MILWRRLAWLGPVVMAGPLLFVLGAEPAQPDSTIIAGRIAYVRECASCHGDAATGYGPAWPALRQPPPDLTILSSRTIPFDRGRIRNIVTGHLRRVPPQWPSEMPYWRTSLDAEFDALLDFLESVQLHRDGAATGLTIEDQARLGAPLYTRFCAACHGVNGRRAAETSHVVGVAPPDLTLLAMRQGGTIDMRRLVESIARIGHASQLMPEWELTFQSMGWSPYETAKNLEDLAWYIESIQRR